MNPDRSLYFHGIPENPSAQLNSLAPISIAPNDNEICESTFISLGTIRRREEGTATDADVALTERRKSETLACAIDIPNVQAQVIANAVSNLLTSENGALTLMQNQITNLQIQNTNMQNQNTNMQNQITNLQNQFTQLQNQITNLQSQNTAIHMDLDQLFNAIELANARSLNNQRNQNFVNPCVKRRGVLTHPPFPFEDLDALRALTGNQLTENLVFYGIHRDDVPNVVAQRRTLLAIHLNIRLGELL
jgi:hypothetical protein